MTSQLNSFTACDNKAAMTSSVTEAFEPFLRIENETSQKWYQFGETPKNLFPVVLEPYSKGIPHKLDYSDARKHVTRYENAMKRDSFEICLEVTESREVFIQISLDDNQSRFGVSPDQKTAIDVCNAIRIFEKR